MANSNSQGGVFSRGESGPVVPLFTSAASAASRPSHAGAGNAPHKLFPKTEFGEGGGVP